MDRKTATELATPMKSVRVFLSLEPKNLNCLKTINCSILRGFKEITSGCLTSSNLMDS